jgi:surfactin synthase thioesterase subunit
LAGERDEIVQLHQVDEWYRYTRGAFSRVLCPGGHDFLSTATAAVTAAVARAIPASALAQ